jgi:biotin--protein ligase
LAPLTPLESRCNDQPLVDRSLKNVAAEETKNDTANTLDMPFPTRLPPPATAAAATAAAVLAAVALRRYLSSRSRAPTSAHRGSTAPAAAATTRLVLSGKYPEDQELLASVAGVLSLEEEGGGELAVSLALDGGGGEGFDAGAYMGALVARRFGRWMLWSPRMASTHDLVTQ